MATPFLQISFEPGFGAYQGLAQKIEVPFSRMFCLFLRDSEMTIKIIFERSSQKGGRRGGSKRGSTGDPP